MVDDINETNPITLGLQKMTADNKVRVFSVT